MSENDTELDALKRALGYDWPEIQRHLIEKAAEEQGVDIDPYDPYWTTKDDGTRVLHFSPDGWWLKNFDRKDVLLELTGVVIMNTKGWHVQDICATLRAVFGVRDNEPCDDCFKPEHILAHISRFPEGQFMAMRISGPTAGHAIAMASTMRTSRPPTAPVLPWRDAIGDLDISAHESEGEWLYGVELAVHPMYQGKGIGSGLYQVRFDLVRSLNLRGWYAVGMLMGYKDYADRMDVVDYGKKVIAREIKDPTVTMQMNRGFRAECVVTDYVDEPAAGNAGVLIVWDNSDFVAEGV